MSINDDCDSSNNTSYMYVCLLTYPRYMSTLVVLGLDLSSAYDIIVPKHGKAIVKTDIAIAIPSNTYARIGVIPRINLVVYVYIYIDKLSSCYLL